MPPKLTPEEKKAAAAKKRIQRKLQLVEKKKQLKRDVLTRELRYSDLTTKRHEKEWRKMLIKISLPNMKNELLLAWHNFERIVDCKDFVISLLMDEIREAEEQYMMNFKNHVKHIDKMIDMFRETLEELYSNHEIEMLKLRQYYQEQTDIMGREATENENYLNTMIHTLEVARKKQKQTVRAEYFSKVEEEETKTTQFVQKLKGILEKVHYTLYTDTTQFLENYNNRVKERKKQHDTLKVRDEALQKLLCNQLEKLRTAYEYIKTLKQKQIECQKLVGRKSKDLEAEYNFFTCAFTTLKNKLILDRQTDAHVLNILTDNYNGTINALEKMRERGEHILHVAAVCRKLETLEEKILPFPSAGCKTDLIKWNVNTEHFNSLQFFWQRVGQAEASKYAFQEERKFLKTENYILKMKLHKYCQCLMCPIPEKNVMRKIKHVTEGTFEKQKYEKHSDKNQFFSSPNSENASIDEY